MSLPHLGFQLDYMSEYYISLDNSEVDVKDIYAGQKVQITLDAIPNTTFSGIV
jgi:multidrug resistance efflux pump